MQQQQQQRRRQRRALHPGVVALSVAVLCLSGSSLLVDGSSKHVAPPGRFLAFRSSFRRPLSANNKGNNKSKNGNGKSESGDTLQQQKPQQQRQRQPPSTSTSTGLHLSASPDEENDKDSFNTNKKNKNNNGIRGEDTNDNNANSNNANDKKNNHNSNAIDEDDEESRANTGTSFFRFPSEVQRQEPQELGGSDSNPAILQQQQQQPSPLSPPSLLPYTSSPSSTSVVHLPTFRFRKQRRVPRRHAQTHAHTVETTFVWSLMGMAGFVEGLCIRRHGCFPNLMTGTVLKLAEAVAGSNAPSAAFCAAMMASYTAGGSVYALWKDTNTNDNDNDNNKRRRNLEGVSVLSALFFVLSDVAASVLAATTSPATAATATKLVRFPLLATAFGILNAGTMDAGAGVTNAMTGHITKIGQGLVRSSGRNNSGNHNDNTSSPAPPPAHATSARGLVVFWAAAVLSNLCCGLLEQGAGGVGVAASSNVVAVVAGGVWLVQRLPLGTTLAIAYGSLIRWYLTASARASEYPKPGGAGAAATKA
mmetsp:Transcript_23298/g.50943  ORF Transcript_23298/g.50943 Transcript_23298/m.50943 type:complete len:534 (+) Transcript_23298:752-2353(+)